MRTLDAGKRQALQILCASALLPAAPLALAQFGARRGRSERGEKSKGGEEPRVNLLETSLEELHEDLKLSAVQEPLWASYADKLRALANDVARERNARPSGASLSLLQRMDRVVDAARNRLTALEDIAQAGRLLFESLSPEQKAAADPRLANLMAQPLARNS
jgi:hypothetical protein